MLGEGRDPKRISHNTALAIEVIHTHSHTCIVMVLFDANEGERARKCGKEKYGRAL